MQPHHRAAQWRPPRTHAHTQPFHGAPRAQPSYTGIRAQTLLRNAAHHRRNAGRNSPRPGHRARKNRAMMVNIMVAGFAVLTIVGVWFRGAHMALAWPWRGGQ